MNEIQEDICPKCKAVNSFAKDLDGKQCFYCSYIIYADKPLPFSWGGRHNACKHKLNPEERRNSAKEIMRRWREERKEE